MKDIKKFLENSVYYPCCSFDGSPIKCLSTIFSNFVYADYLRTYEELEEDINDNGLKGYELIKKNFINPEDLFGLDWENFININYDITQHMRFEWEDPYAVLLSFKRRKGFKSNHGRRNIYILFIKSEGISAYKYLYVKRNIAPKCLVSINPGLGFGCNFSEYLDIFSDWIDSTGKLPEYQFENDFSNSISPFINEHYKVLKVFKMHYYDYGIHNYTFKKICRKYREKLLLKEREQSGIIMTINIIIRDINTGLYIYNSTESKNVEVTYGMASLTGVWRMFDMIRYRFHDSYIKKMILKIPKRISFKQKRMIINVGKDKGYNNIKIVR